MVKLEKFWLNLVLQNKIVIDKFALSIDLFQLEEGNLKRLFKNKGKFVCKIFNIKKIKNKYRII